MQEESVCWLCHEPIDYSLKTPHPDSYELDEFIPVSKGGDPLDRNNVGASHRKCNRKKGDRILGWVDGVLTDLEKNRPVTEFQTSQDWFS